MKKAFAYLRVSSQGQVDGDGFKRQEKAIQDYAKSTGLEIVDVFKEEISGTTEDRPTLAKLLVSLEHNGHDVKTVVIEKLDRLARDLMVQEAIVRDFQQLSVELVSAMEGPDLGENDPTRKLIRQVFGAVAEYEKSMLVLKLRAARNRKRAKGEKVEGRKGYRDTPEGQAILRSIAALRRPRKYGGKRTYKEVAEALNEQGTSSMSGKPWTGQMVRDALRERER